MDKWNIAGFAATVIGIGMAPLKKVPKWVSYGIISIGVVILLSVMFINPTPSSNHSETKAESINQIDSITNAGNNNTIIYNQQQKAISDEKEKARKKKIREDLSAFIEKLQTLDMAFRGGWSLEEMERQGVKDAAANAFQYLKKNFDESYARHFNNPLAGEKRDEKEDHRQQYQGQGMSELTEAQIRYLEKIIEENK